MEHFNDAAKMLDLMGRPAFCAADHKIIRVNAAAAGLGIRADEAYPGGRIPALTGPVAAVRLGKVDRSG